MVRIIQENQRRVTLVAVVYATAIIMAGGLALGLGRDFADRAWLGMVVGTGLTAAPAAYFTRKCNVVAHVVQMWIIAPANGLAGLLLLVSYGGSQPWTDGLCPALGVAALSLVGFGLSTIVAEVACDLLRKIPEPLECETCGYELTGNVSGICPECGTPFASSTPSSDEIAAAAMRELNDSRLRDAEPPGGNRAQPLS